MIDEVVIDVGMFYEWTYFLNIRMKVVIDRKGIMKRKHNKNILMIPKSCISYDLWTVKIIIWIAACNSS